MPEPPHLSNTALRAAVLGLEQMLGEAIETLTYIAVEQPDPQQMIDAANETLRKIEPDD